VIIETEYKTASNLAEYLAHKALDPEWVADHDGQWAWNHAGLIAVTRVHEYVIITGETYYEGVTKCESVDAAIKLEMEYGVASEHDITVNAYERRIYDGDSRQGIDVPKTDGSDDEWLKLAAKAVEEHCEATGCYPTPWVSYDYYGTPVGYLHNDGSVTQMKVLS